MPSVGKNRNESNGYRLRYALFFAIISLVPSAVLAKDGVKIDDAISSYTRYPHFLGESFYLSQVLFLGILFFIFLFIFFQFLQNKRQDYFFYALYILVSWLYSARVNPFCFFFLFNNKDAFDKFCVYFKHSLCNATELIFFYLLVAVYAYFLRAFFDFKNQNHKEAKIIRSVGVTALFLAIIQTIWILFTGLESVPGLEAENLIKALFLPTSLWMIVLIRQSKKPGRNLIITGTSLLLLGCIVTASTSLLQHTYKGDRLFMQIGTLAEILFFAAALGRKDRAARQNEILSILAQREAVVIDTGEKSTDIQHQSDATAQTEIQEHHDAKQKWLIRLKAAIDRDLAYTRENGAESDFFTVKKYAREFHMAPVTLYTIVKSVTGKDTKTFILTYLLEKAKTEIERTKTALNLIAEWYGFSSPAHFSTAFKRVYGFPPSGLRGEEG